MNFPDHTNSYEGLKVLTYSTRMDAPNRTEVYRSKMSQRSKNHHFVPQILQKQFAAERGGIWYSKRGEDNVFDPPQLRNTRTVFRIRDYYTILKGDERSDVVEREFYGQIDDYLGTVLPNILQSFENSVIPTFSGEPLNSLRRVVLEMTKRTPEFTKKYDDTITGREIVESTVAALSKNPSNEERLRSLNDLENPSRLREIGRSARVQAAIDRSSKVEQALEDFSVRWVVSETHHSFILSSMMVYRIGNGGPNALSNPNMEFWMPIAPKISLVLVRDKEERIPLKFADNRDHIRKVNEYATRSSKHIASHSEQLLKSLIGSRARLESK